MLKFQWVFVALVLYFERSFCQLSVCGRAPLNTRLMDGFNASEGAWPWQVILQRSKTNDSHFCGGSLINKQWVLTAAQCFSSKVKSAIVHLGMQTFNGANSNKITRSVKKVILHPKYNSTTNNNDIALLKLDKTVSFTNHIRPVCLAGQGSRFPEGTVGFITGWGNVDTSVNSPDVLQEAVVPITDALVCDNLLNVGSITTNMICAGYIQGGPDTCQGDFGGPMVMKLGAAWIQAGITSWGEGCAQHNSPSVYTKMSQYQIWISSIIKKDLPGFVKYLHSGTTYGSIDRSGKIKTF